MYSFWQKANRLPFSVTPHKLSLAKSNEQINTNQKCDDLLITKGVLSNKWYATQEVASVKYYISDGTIFSCEPVPAEALLLTPAIPFSTDLLYDLYDEAVLYDATGTRTHVDFTPENFPHIEMDNTGWHDNYGSLGTITITDVDGNVYQTSENHSCTYIEYHHLSNDSEERYWEAEHQWSAGHENIIVTKVE